MTETERKSTDLSEQMTEAERRSTDLREVMSTKIEPQSCAALQSSDFLIYDSPVRLLSQFHRSLRIK